MNRAYRDYCRHMGAAMFQRPVFTGPTLNNEELLAVYQTARSTDLDILRDTAIQMFPERFQDKPPQLYAHQGGATAFRQIAPQRGPRKAALEALWGEEPQRNERAMPAGRGEGYGACGDNVMAYPY